MNSQRILQAGGWLVGGVVVMLVALYAITSRSPVSEPLTSGPTPYPSIVLFPTLVPPPSPDMRPHIVDLSSGQLQSVPIPSDSQIQAVLSDGTLLAAGGPQGRAMVIRSDGTLIADLPIPLYARSELSTGHRYVAWIAGDHFRAYDAETAQILTEPPPAARFEGSFSDGSVLMGDTAGWPASPPSASGGQPGEETVIVDRSGAATDRLPVPRWIVAVSSDGQRIAWVDGLGLHVYERSTHADRAYSEVTAVTGQIAWSPDGAEIAYVRFTGNDAVYVWVVDVALGAQHRVYSAVTGARIQRVAFTTNHDLELQIGPASAHFDLPGARYLIADDGSGGRFFDDPARPWSACGPTCGMPPTGYEDADGLARWCEQSRGGGCSSHLVFVDRGAGVAREVATSDFIASSISPDRRQLAILLSVGSDQLLRIVQLADLTSRDIPLGFTYATEVVWLPDGASLLLFSVGGN